MVSEKGAMVSQQDARASWKGSGGSEQDAVNSEKGVTMPEKGATSSQTTNTIKDGQKKGDMMLNSTYPQREWNTCPGVFCPFGWIHAAGDEKKIEEIEALGDITNAAEAKTLSTLKVNPRRYSLKALLMIGEAVGGNALGFLDPRKFKADAIEENLLKVTAWHRIRGVADVSQGSEDRTAPPDTDMMVPVRQPNNPPPSFGQRPDAGFAKIPIRQPKPAPLSVKDQYEQGFLQYPERQPFSAPDPNELTAYDTLNSEWPGFNPYNPIRQPRQPPKDLGTQALFSFAQHPTRQPIAAPAIDPEESVSIGFKNNRPQHPIRQPMPAPTKGKIHVVSTNFKREEFQHFLEQHRSPTHQRVTAGGRIVAFNPEARPPQFDLRSLTELRCTSNGKVHVVGPPRRVVESTSHNVPSQNPAPTVQAPTYQNKNATQSGTQNGLNTVKHVFLNQAVAAAQMGNHNAFQTQGVAAAPMGNQNVFQTQGVAAAQMGNQTVPGIAQQMSWPVGTAFHNQGVGAMPQFGQGQPLVHHVYSPQVGSLLPATAQQAGYQQVMMIPQTHMVAFNMQTGGTGVNTGGYQPYASNPNVTLNQYPTGAVIRTGLESLTGNIAVLEGVLKNLGLEIQKTEMELKLLDSQRSYFDDQLGDVQKADLIAKRRDIVTRRSQLRRQQRQLEDVASGKQPEPGIEVMDSALPYTNALGQAYMTGAQNAIPQAPQALFQQPPLVPMTFGPAANLNRAQGAQTQAPDSHVNMYPGIPAEYVESQIASPGSCRGSSPQKNSALNVRAKEFNPNGSNGQERGSVGGNAQTTRRVRRSSSEEIKKEWEQISHAEASGSTGHLGDNLAAIANEEVIRKMLDAISGQAGGALNGRITLRIGDREVTIQSGSEGGSEPVRSNAAIRAEQRRQVRNELIRIRTSSGSINRSSCNIDNHEELLRSQSSRVPYIPGISPFKRGSNNGLPSTLSSSSAGPSTPSGRQDPHRHKVSSSVASQNINAQGHLDQMDGAADYLGPISAKDKKALAGKGTDKASTPVEQKALAGKDFDKPSTPVEQKNSDTKVKNNHGYRKLSRAAADGRDVVSFFKLIREEEDQVIAKYKTENPM